MIDLCTPSDADRAALADLKELLVIGAGGKMGPSLIERARRAAPHARIIGVARSGSDISADLLDRDQVNALPDSENVIFLAGRKFGSTGNEGLTWATNALLPGMIAEKYRGARIVALSSGNIYPLTATERMSRRRRLRRVNMRSQCSRGSACSNTFPVATGPASH